MSQTPVTNLQPTLTMAEYIDTAGAFPPRDGGGDGPFLGEIDISAANPDIFAFPAEGQTLAINRYEADFSIIGTYYGGDGIRSFQLPNLSGAEMIGTGQGTGLPNYVTGESTGTASNTILPADVPSSLGGGGQTLNNDQPSVAITYAINATGIYPSGTLSSGTIGVVTAFAGNFPPGSELACNGQLLSISQYEALYNVIGTTYGGDGITTFALPNLMGRDIVGSGQNPVDGTNYVLGQDVGAATVGISKANLPASGDQPIDNVQPGLAMNYYIATTGVFPSNPTAEGAPSGEAYIGQIFAFAGDLSDPDGCLPCAGQLLQIQQYQALYALLGNTYGGDGVTTFALPDLRGKSILGVGASNPEGQEQGSATTALVNADFTPPSVGSLTSNPTDAVQGGAGVAVLAATPTGLTAAMTNGDLQSVTVTIAKPQIGDLLGVGGNFTLSGTATAFTTSNGGNFLATYINGVLEIANTAGVLNTVAQYEAAMALVDYEDAGTDASTSQHPTRTLDWVANDGIQNSATATSSIVIDRPPVLTPETVTVQLPIGGATDSTNDQGVLAPAFASDLDGDPLTVSAVNGASGSVGAAVAGVDGTLTLNANGSFSYQLTGLASPTDSFSYTVSDGKGGTATQTLTFDAPAAVAPQIDLARQSVRRRRRHRRKRRGRDRHADRDALARRRRRAERPQRGQRWQFGRSDHGRLYDFRHGRCGDERAGRPCLYAGGEHGRRRHRLHDQRRERRQPRSGFGFDDASDRHSLLCAGIANSDRTWRGRGRGFMRRRSRRHGCGSEPADPVDRSSQGRLPAPSPAARGMAVPRSRWRVRRRRAYARSLAEPGALCRL
jgi:microcystin-dependent protein